MAALRTTLLAVAAALVQRTTATAAGESIHAPTVLPGIENREHSERAELWLQNEQQESAIATLRRTISELETITAEQAAVLEQLSLSSAGVPARAVVASAGQGGNANPARVGWNRTVLDSVHKKLSTLKSTVTEQRVNDAMLQNEIRLAVESWDSDDSGGGDAAGAAAVVGDRAKLETPQTSEGATDDSRALSAVPDSNEASCHHHDGNLTDGGVAPKLYIEGACSADDVVVQGRSINGRLNALESEVEALLSPPLCDTTATWNPRIVASVKDDAAFHEPANLVVSADGR